MASNDFEPRGQGCRERAASRDAMSAHECPDKRLVVPSGRDNPFCSRAVTSDGGIMQGNQTDGQIERQLFSGRFIPNGTVHRNTARCAGDELFSGALLVFSDSE
jgi:hypothetical protein